jgi:hypothetical protein
VIVSFMGGDSPKGDAGYDQATRNFYGAGRCTRTESKENNPVTRKYLYRCTELIVNSDLLLVATN